MLSRLDELKSGKLTKKQEELLKFIEHQISISLFDLVEHGFTTRKIITIDIYDMSEDDERSIQRLGHFSGRYRTEPNGHKMMGIRLA